MTLASAEGPPIRKRIVVVASPGAGGTAQLGMPGPHDLLNLLRQLRDDEKRTYELIESDSADAAAEVEAAVPPPDALVLNDDGLDALEVLERLIGTNAIARCPVVVLVGDLGEERCRAMLRAGAQECIPRHSITVADLRHALANAAERWKLASEKRHLRDGVQEQERQSAQAVRKLEVQRQEDDFSSLADNMSQLAWMTDAGGSIFWYNRRWYEYTGTRLEDMSGWGWTAVHHPDHVGRVVANARARFAADEAWEDVFPLRGADGKFRWFLTRAVPIRDNTGKVVRWLGTNTDISDQRAVELALRARERELQTLADNTPDMLARYDAELRHVFINAVGEQTLGRPLAELLGHSNRELNLPVEYCETLEAGLRQVFATKVSCAVDLAMPSQLGQRYYSARIVPELDADNRICFALVVTHDITDRKLHEQTLAEQDRRKDEFIATLAHELRNPLAPIRSGLAFVRMEPLSVMVEPVIGMIERQVEQLVDLVDDLLDVARVSQGKIQLRRVRMSLQEAIRGAVEACQSTLDARAHQLILNLHDEPLTIDGDRTRMVQIISNLLTNSSKYCSPGGRIEVTTHAEEGAAVLTVTDNGEGIDAKDLATIWDMFSQVRDTIDKAQGGLGIGLTLVKRLVSMHGGTVSAQSAGLGQGATFTLRLPLAEPEPPARAEAPTGAMTGAPTNPPATPGAAGPEVPRRRVLVVDDNEDSAEVLAMVLQRAGHEVVTAYDGLTAVASAQRFTPEVMIVDIGLPGINGYEVARRLRADPAIAKVFLIALTGWGSDDDRRRAAEAGFDVHLTKPIDASVVRKLIAQLAPA
jgi:PAS domain S-box-containing protein